MKKMFLVVMCLGFCGCSAETFTLDKTTKIDNIQMVFINRPNDYTVVVQEKNQLIPKSIYGQVGGEVRVFTDAKGAMWAEVREFKSNHGKRLRREADIHIYSTNNLQGGQWREKQGKKSEQVGNVNQIK